VGHRSLIALPRCGGAPRQVVTSFRQARRMPTDPPPSRRVNTWTFLFTDIEGSTALFERAPESYRAALAGHFDLLEGAIAAHAGRVFRSTGDGVQAVFEDSAQAMRSAIACQQALAAAAWPEEIGSLRVRIGLHRGAAEPAEDDFHGLTMHHATRVLDAAHGGQSICSAVVREHAGDAIATEALCDLGLYRLRGVPTPVQIFQVVAPGIAAPAFPPLRTAAAFTHSLPAVPTRFFGRQAELHELAPLLTPEPRGGNPRRYGRLVTLLGPGGTGKTRLSLAVGESLLHAYSHAVWFVPLAEISDAQLLPDVLLAALGLTGEPGRPAHDQLVEHLGAQPALLILDNFEQLVPAGVETVRHLLERLPQLVCLVSSRIRLELSAEQEFSVAPLLLPPATGGPEELLRYPSVQLFCDRARQVRREFQLGEANAAEIAQLCRALEGIPLALELAAARIATLSPRQMLGKLEHRLDFLVGRKQDFSRRHRTLRAAVAWSYELLTPPLQSLLAQLSIFQGGWTLEAAEALAAEGEALSRIDGLAELQRCSLIIADEIAGSMRYRMLEVIREFARERLSREEHAAAIERAHVYFVALAEGDSPMEEAGRLRELEADHDNFRAMLAGPRPAAERLRAAIALYWFWEIRGYLREGRDWLRRLRVGVEDARLQARAAGSAGILAATAGDFADARAQFDAALAYWEETGETRNAAATLNSLGITACDSRDHQAAAAYYARSLALFRQLDAPSETGAVLANLGENALLLGGLATAREGLSEALAIQRRLGEQWRIGNTLHSLAELHSREHDGAAARRLLAECIAIRLSLGARDWLAQILITLAEIAWMEDRRPLAAQICGAAQAAGETASMPLPPVFAAKLEAHTARLRSCLGEATFAQHALRGRSTALHRLLDAAGEWVLPLDINSPACS